MTALATWKRGRQDNEVEVLSRPDATGMVDVLMVWNQQHARAHREALEPKNDTASRLLEMAERFVVLPGPAKSVIRPEPKPTKPKAIRLPGQRIERAQAQVLFGANEMLGIHGDARLRLLGLPNGDVALRAYDAEGMICERIYGQGGTLSAKADKPKAKPAPQAQKPKPVTPPAQTVPSNADVKTYVHPDFGIALREVSPSVRLAAHCGSIGAARMAIYKARKDSGAPPSGYAFSMSIGTPHGLTQIYIVAVRKNRADGQEFKEVRALLDEADRLELVEGLRVTAYEFTVGAL